MKLLLDENLSSRITYRIIDLYPDSEHVKTLALTNTDDAIIWEHAKANDFVIVSKDSDFHQRSFLYGHPPKRQFKSEVHHLEGCPGGTHRDSLMFTTTKRHPHELHPA